MAFDSHLTGCTGGVSPVTSLSTGGRVTSQRKERTVIFQGSHKSLTSGASPLPTPGSPGKVASPKEWASGSGRPIPESTHSSGDGHRIRCGRGTQVKPQCELQALLSEAGLPQPLLRAGVLVWGWLRVAPTTVRAGASSHLTGRPVGQYCLVPGRAGRVWCAFQLPWHPWMVAHTANLGSHCLPRKHCHIRKSTLASPVTWRP